MKLPDPYSARSGSPENRIVFAGSQLIGTRDTQEDAMGAFVDECFVLSDGVSGVPHGDVASRLTVDTTVWGYKHIRMRPYYWEDKQKLLARMFRSTNLSVWQKRKESGYEDGLAATLSVVIIGAHHLWAGSIGDSPIYMYRDGLIDTLAEPDTDDIGRLTQAIGIQRLGLAPHIKKEIFLPGDIIIMATDGVTDFVSEDELRVACEMAGTSSQSAANAVVHLLRQAEENGSDGNKTAYIIVKQKILRE